MFNRRTKNIAIFEDTCQQINESDKLHQGVIHSIENQKLYLQSEKYTYDFKKSQANKLADIVVSGKRTLQAAKAYAKAGKKVAVLNFASATNPGGGVKHGSSAQEEALCRCSTLYPCLDTKEMWNKFYVPHRRADNPIYNDDIIHTPDVWVCRSDVDFPERLREEEWYQVDVITCAAPNLRRAPSNAMNPHAGTKKPKLTAMEYRSIMKSRIRQIFMVAQATNADVLILGAFGCGAFCNPPEVVAELFKEAVEEFGMAFETIEFAVFHREFEAKNYEAFREKFEEWK